MAGGQGIQYLVSLQWPVVQLDFSDGMHMTENSHIPQSARMRAQIQANTRNFASLYSGLLYSWMTEKTHTMAPEIQNSLGSICENRWGGRT